MVSASALAAAGGMVGSLFNYNRANYMFDVPLQQNREFQVQNMEMLRYGLFREDIRDLSALCSEKQLTYLVINTLQLGFIVMVYFNGDRASPGNEAKDSRQDIMDVLSTITLFTAFFWLSTSIWYSMYTVILSQSFATKMLLQVVRLPLPTISTIKRIVPNAEAFEGSFREAFRLPFLSRAQPQSKTSKLSKEEEDRYPSLSRVGSPRQEDRFAFLARGNSPKQEELQTFDTPRQEHSRGGADAGQDQAETPPQGISALDLIHGVADVSDGGRREVHPIVGPHVKLFTLVSNNWTSFDFYGKVAMVIGSSTMYSGFSYWCLMYLRKSGPGVHPERGSWCAFWFLTVSAWWTLISHLDVSYITHAMIIVLMHAGPVCMVVIYMYADGFLVSRWRVTLIYCLEASWVVMLMWSVVIPWGKWPSAWRYRRFLNILHHDDAPAPALPPLPVPSASTYVSTDLDLESSGGESSSCDSNASEVPQVFTVEYASLAADSFLSVLDSILHGTVSSSEQHLVRQARDNLCGAAKAAGVLQIGEEVSARLDGFWVKSAGSSKHWIWICQGGGCPGGGGLPKPGAQRVDMSSVLRAAGEAARVLRSNSMRWTAADTERLALYGGERFSGIDDFVSQFLRVGSSASSKCGGAGRKQFVGAAALITVAWMLAIIWSAIPSTTAPVAIDNSGHLEMEFSRIPWLAPKTLGCSANGSWLVLGDGRAAYLTQVNSSEMLGPTTPCAGDGGFAADYGPGDEAWVACAGGIVPMRTQAPQLVSGDHQGLAVGNLEALALDAALPGSLAATAVAGLALHRNELVAVQADAGRGTWRLAGIISAPSLPEGHKWKALALRGGRGLALSGSAKAEGADKIFEWDAATGSWAGPRELPGDYVWHGVCALPGGQEWRALGQCSSCAGSVVAGPPEVWRFPRGPASREPQEL